jgi:hypothetical protein
LQLGTSRRRSRSGIVSRSTEINIPDAVSPLGEGRFERPIFDDDDASSSVYSLQPTARVSPLHLSHVRSQNVIERVDDLYNDPSVRELETRPEALINTPLFSPLQFYFRGTDYPTAKKGEKTMIGDNGWLERTDRGVVDHVAKTPQKKTGILDSIKKMAKDVVSQSELEILS